MSTIEPFTQFFNQKYVRLFILGCIQTSVLLYIINQIDRFIPFMIIITLTVVVLDTTYKNIGLRLDGIKKPVYIIIESLLSLLMMLLSGTRKTFEELLN
jgi:uncharacterized membrane protein